eukprot:gene29582-biopygen5497
MKPFGDISEDQWDKLVSLAKGDKDEKLGLIEFLQADQDQADFVSCINPFGVRIKPNGKARILVDPTITGLTNFSKLIFSHSFNEHGVKATCDVYVDDYPIRADTHADMQRAFEIINRESELLGLEFNPSKDEDAIWFRKYLRGKNPKFRVLATYPKGARIFLDPSSGKTTGPSPHTMLVIRSAQ